MLVLDAALSLNCAATMTPAVEDPEVGGSAQKDQLEHLPKKRPRTLTSTEEIDNTITRPGSVKINVTGAFIVDPDTASPTLGNGHVSGRVSPNDHGTRDIRLPNHTAVVSHIAIDVSHTLALPMHPLRP